MLTFAFASQVHAQGQRKQHIMYYYIYEHSFDLIDILKGSERPPCA